MNWIGMAREEIARRIATLGEGAGYTELRDLLRPLPSGWDAAHHPPKAWRAEVHAHLRATLTSARRCTGAKWCGNLGDTPVTVKGGLLDIEARFCKRHARTMAPDGAITTRELARQQGATT